jgi:uncharacterized protein (TIGR02611 family)
VIEKAKENWRRFKESEQSHRFQDRHRRHQENRRGGFDPWTLLRIGGGIFVVVGGLIAVPGPGPGWVITFLGLGLIAGEFRPVARFMDRAEVNLRALARWAVGAWSSSSTGIKVLICLAILLSLATLGYVAYYLFFSGSNFLTTLQ